MAYGVEGELLPGNAAASPKIFVSHVTAHIPFPGSSKRKAAVTEASETHSAVQMRRSPQGLTRPGAASEKHPVLRMRGSPQSLTRPGVASEKHPFTFSTQSLTRPGVASEKHPFSGDPRRGRATAETGETVDAGERGEREETGKAGDTGETGDTCETGETGPVSIQVLPDPGSTAGTPQGQEGRRGESRCGELYQKPFALGRWPHVSLAFVAPTEHWPPHGRGRTAGGCNPRGHYHTTGGSKSSSSSSRNRTDIGSSSGTSIGRRGGSSGRSKSSSGGGGRGSSGSSKRSRRGRSLSEDSSVGVGPNSAELTVLLLHKDSFCWNSFLRHDNPAGYPQVHHAPERGTEES